LVGENAMGLSSGEVMSIEDLLYGVFMYSGNDAAETLATNTMERSRFVETMNKKAKAIGLENTHFTNPTGLQGDGDQYTTAYDLLVLSRYAVSNYPQILKYSSTAEHFIPATDDHKAFELYNQTNLITSYPGVKGLKDGYTPEAGLCLVTYLDYKGHQLIGIILGSENRRQEMKDLLDYSLTKQGVNPPPHS
jgi:D-alanyl-D-alanine carboxypeptidase (penicillin-binding protein 5/6)